MNTLIRLMKPTHSNGWALGAILLLASAVVAAPEVAPAPRSWEPAPTPRTVVRRPLPWSVTDTQEVVVFAPNRPVRILLNTQCEGKSIAEMWQSRLRNAYEYFDRDKDGFLNEKETQSIFSDMGVNVLLQNGFYQATPQDRPTLERLDSDRNGRVSFDEYLAYYLVSSANLVRPQPAVAENATGAAVTEALFKMLDANGDGKLTRDEVKAAEKLLVTKDADEDECLSQAELVPNIFNQGFGRQVRPVGGGFGPQQPVQAAQVVMTFDPKRVPGTLTQQVIKKYDKDGDFELTREEVGFDEATFVRLDADANGRLDGEELEAWRTGPADLEVVISHAPKAADCFAKLVTNREDANARGFVIKQVDAGRLIIRTGRQPIEFWAMSGNIGYQPGAMKTQYAYMFQQAAKGKDHVLEKDLTGPNAVQFQFLRTLFEGMDVNGDGKLTKVEFDAYFDLQDSFRNVSMAVTPAVQTPTLFQLLDENRDGRLSVRELRTAWERLLALEPNGDEVTKAAIMPSVSLRLTRAAERYLVTQQQFNNPGVNPNQVVVPQKGPMWFRKMDRNGDGDVSRSEFLGTKAEFEAIDGDKDSLISLEEAETYDKKLRPADEKKPDEKK
ncbi:MAG: hypothetical protein C0467_08750 [Planctomycetaceae bacterium]|nr:hypothetical protein [Planctomycetaceae bacterium]